MDHYMCEEGIYKPSARFLLAQLYYRNNIKAAAFKTQSTETNSQADCIWGLRALAGEQDRIFVCRNTADSLGVKQK